jgi:hypothetical protein
LVAPSRTLEKRREWRRRKVEEGICTRCGCRPASPGVQECAVCKQKSKLKAQRWRSRLPAGHDRNRHLRELYGLTSEDFNDLLVSQGGVCAICYGDGSSHKRGLVVDHAHETGTIRGILCSQCNVGLGYFRDDLTLLLRASGYLFQWLYQVGQVGITKRGKKRARV